MPDGTVFSDIVDSYFDPNGTNGDMTINGINIMCGHGEWCPVESGRFNGVLHMLSYIPCTGTYVDTYVVIDDKIITARSAAASIDFAFKILEVVKGKETEEKIKKQIYY